VVVFDEALRPQVWASISSVAEGRSPEATCLGTAALVPHVDKHRRSAVPPLPDHLPTPSKGYPQTPPRHAPCLCPRFPAWSPGSGDVFPGGRLTARPVRHGGRRDPPAARAIARRASSGGKVRARRNRVTDRCAPDRRAGAGLMVRPAHASHDAAFPTGDLPRRRRRPNDRAMLSRHGSSASRLWRRVRRI